jgi:hypothetical protein
MLSGERGGDSGGLLMKIQHPIGFFAATCRPGKALANRASLAYVTVYGVLQTPR